jgi:putative addiction module component (TIGR02574 family)
MAETLEQFKSQLRRLTTKERADLAYYLLESLDSAEEGTDAAWNIEISRRVAEIRAGHAVGKAAEQVFAELRSEGL